MLRISAVMKRASSEARNSTGVRDILWPAGAGEYLHDIEVPLEDVPTFFPDQLGRLNLARSHAVDPDMVTSPNTGDIAGESFGCLPWATEYEAGKGIPGEQRPEGVTRTIHGCQ